MGEVKNIIGEKFGYLTVTERAENSKDGKARWHCVCDCGNHVTVIGKCLRNGHTKSCGCLNKEVVSKMSLNDLSGKRFGKLVVSSRAGDYISPSGTHHVMWNCVCDCGESTVVDTNQLRRGRTKSCGCLRSEIKPNLRHGGRKDRLYKVFVNMKNRCYNKNSDDFKYYGGCGIRICDEWINNYPSFKKWAYDSGYVDSASFGECTIDRIDVNGNYEPNNCRWVNMAIQSANRRNVIAKKQRQMC